MYWTLSQALALQAMGHEAQRSTAQLPWAQGTAWQGAERQLGVPGQLLSQTESSQETGLHSTGRHEPMAVPETVMVWTSETELPQSSTAVQVRSKVLSAGQVPTWGRVVSPESEKVISMALSQLSVAEARPVLARSVASSAQEMVMSLGMTRTGLSRSLTKMRWVAETSLPQASAAVQTREMVEGQVPSRTVSTGARTVTTTPQGEVAVAKPPVLAGAVESSQSMVVSSGMVMMGSWLRSISMIWLRVTKLPQPSVAFQVRVRVTPLGQRAPVSMSANSMSISRGLAQLSVAVGTPWVAGVLSEPHSMLVFSGKKSKAGLMVSVMRMVWGWEKVLPQASVTVQVRVIPPVQPFPLLESSKSTVGLRVQSSVPVGAPVNSGVVPSSQLTVLVAGKLVNEGFLLSV
mmetsp:Transcript_42795/g.71158  ORF Transcript_42795/g.71158 Transcript_42795/m.71158 type:complete len:404 (+) Transcript_42795:230-1441(+)